MIKELKQIDFVLDYIKENAPQFELLTTDKVVQYIRANGETIEIDRHKFNQIIDRLKEDELIEVKGPDNRQYYNITFKGSIFIGYEQTEKDRVKSYLQAKANQKAILYLTLVIAVGTSVAAAYYFYQLYDGKSVAHPYAAQYILGVAIGVGILILVLEYLRGNKSK